MIYISFALWYLECHKKKIRSINPAGMEVIQKIQMAYIEWINSLENKKEAYTQATVQKNNIAGDQNHDLEVR